MQADLSRRTFDAAKHFSAVLSQQGRVQLDADANEQAAILLHQLRTVVADILGPAAAPDGPHAGFGITPVTDDSAKTVDLAIAPGRMYVDGILVENDQPTTYWQQPDGYLSPEAVTDQIPPAPFVVYLRVWERLITAVQDPAIREIALGDPGPDTAARSKVVWQVATHQVENGDNENGEGGDNGGPQEFPTWLASLIPRGLLAARATRPDSADEDPCHLSPASRFRGPENQLYRVEVHSGGPAWTDQPAHAAASPGYGATFKWSRENASVVFPIVSISGTEVELTTLGRDGKLGLEVGDWVEIVDDASASRVADDVVLDGPVPPAPALRRVVSVDAADRLVILSGEPVDDCGTGTRSDLHPFLRRWDHHAPPGDGRPKRAIAEDGALPLVEDGWLDLEDGVQVRFRPGGDGAGTYRRGDYWLIPARTVNGDVEWPVDDAGPVARQPHGVDYRYALLAFFPVRGDQQTLRPLFAPLPAVVRLAGQAGGAQAATPQPSAPAESAPVAAPKPRSAAGRRTSTSAKEKDKA